MDLSALIDVHRGGRSYAELARDCGGSPTDKRLQQLVRVPIKNFPDPGTIAALARGLRVTQGVVVLAAAESLGLDVRTSMPRLVELLPAVTSQLTEQQAAAIAHLVRTFLEPVDAEVDTLDDEYDGPVPNIVAAIAAQDEARTRREQMQHDTATTVSKAARPEKKK